MISSIASELGRQRIARVSAIIVIFVSLAYDLACSIGVTPVPVDDGKSFESLIAEADAAMYIEKRRRKSTYVETQIRLSA